jgi:hypothetical protein
MGHAGGVGAGSAAAARALGGAVILRYSVRRTRDGWVATAYDRSTHERLAVSAAHATEAQAVAHADELARRIVAKRVTP